jgi:hypothetical protein
MYITLAQVDKLTPFLPPPRCSGATVLASAFIGRQVISARRGEEL